jgi:flagellar hook-associated protein 1 FlgK
MSLTVALQYAVSGLTATQAQIQVISGNIANSQTPGYSTETLPQLATGSTDGGAAVITGEIQRATDTILHGAILGQTTASSAAATLNTYSQQVQNLLGQVGSGDTIADTLDNFTSAMQTLATTPQDAVAQASAVNAGQQLAQQLNSLSSGVQGLRGNADGQIGADVGTLNTALNTIAQLNGQISQLQAMGQSTATLQDQRDQSVAQVSQLVGISTYARPDGTLEVLTSQGQSLVDGTTANQFGFTPAGSVTATTALSPLTLDGTDVTSTTTTGEIGALLQMRDTTLPNLTAQLDQFTNNLFNQTTAPDLQTTNSGLGATNDANHFFAAVNTAGGLDNAATIQVNPDLVSNPTLLDTNAGSPDPSIAATLSSNLQATTNFAAAGGLAAITTTLPSYVGDVIGSAANSAASATSNANDQSALLTQMQTQYSNATGVNLDAQLSTLVVYQNAYSASARVISTIQTMYDALMNISLT